MRISAIIPTRSAADQLEPSQSDLTALAEASREITDSNYG